MKTCFYFPIAFTFFTFLSCNSSTPSEKSSSTVSEAKTEKKSEVKKTIVFFGNSITAAYGIDEQHGFTALIGKRIDSLQLPYQVVNAGNSGETSQGGKSRISWILEKPVDIFMLELGANDGLRGIDLNSTRQNLQAILDSVKTKHPDCRIILAGMKIPPNLGKDYTDKFEKLFPELAEKNKTVLIPFLLEGVGGNPKLNQSDGIHPTIEGHKILAETVWKTMKPLLVSTELE